MPKRIGPADVTNVANAKDKLANPNTITVLHVHRWVLWWFYVGVVCGVVALANIFFRDLTRTQEEVILFLGVMHWLLGGLVCWAWEGVKFENSVLQQNKEVAGDLEVTDGQILSDVMVRGSGQLRPTASERLRLLTYYLQRREKQHHA